MPTATRQAYKHMLTTDHEEHSLALPSLLVTGKDPSSATKAKLIATLVAAMPWAVLDSHNPYMSDMEIEKRQTLDYYRASGSNVMNEYMRSGRIQLDHQAAWTATRKMSQVMVIEKQDASCFKPGQPVPKKALQKVSKKIVASVLAEVTQVIEAEVARSAQVLDHVQRLRDIIEESPGLSANTTLWRGETLPIEYFHRPSTSKSKASSKHAFAMRALKKGDIFARPDFTSFSMDVTTSYGFTYSGCCLFRLQAKKGAKILVLDSISHPQEYECIATAGMSFEVVRVRNIASTVSKDHTFRVIDIRILEKAHKP